MQPKLSGKTFDLKINWSRLGMSLSILCAIHCLAMPFVITLLPLAGAAFHLDGTTEFILIGSSIILSSLTLGRDYYRHHRSTKPVAVLIFAILVISILNIAPIPDSLKWLESTGGILIFVAFLVNRKQMKNFHTCAVHGHEH
jgi:hypothetical protein